MSDLDELRLPELDGAIRPIEVARLWIDGEKGTSYVSMNYGLFEDREFEVWASLAADLLAHAIRAHRLDGHTVVADHAVSNMLDTLRERLGTIVDLKGHFPDRREH